MDSQQHLLQQMPKVEPLPDPVKATDAELLELWAKNRNGMFGHVCADEYMRRRFIEEHLS